MRKTLIRATGTAVILCGLMAATTTSATGVDTAVAASSSTAVPALAAGSMSDLPRGAPPHGYAYAIGKRIFLNGRMHDLTPYWSTIARKGLNDPAVPQEFADVDQTRGVMLWAFTRAEIDPYLDVGNLVVGQAPTRLSSDTAVAPIATTSGGYYSVGLYDAHGGPGSSKAYAYSGQAAPPPLTDPEPDPLAFAEARVGSATSALVVNVPHTAAGGGATVDHDNSWIYRPRQGQTPLPHHNTYAAGNGQLVTRDGYRGSCWRTASLATPESLRARVCSQVFPKVSTDGARVAVVQDRHVRFFNASTGALLSTTNAPALTAWDASHFYTLLGWEDTSNVLVKARDGAGLYILRCNVSGACQRAVTSTVRAGVSGIVT